MTLSPTACYRALSARDPRFDGVFFVGVSSTGIYCRPVCPARLPARERCSFHPSAAAAEGAGFRPCLRCRPERAPGRALVDAHSRLARAAFDRIQAGALNAETVEALARSLGSSPRQLRRALVETYGASPVQLAQTRRLLSAKQLLAESDLGISHVAMAAGFGSYRRMNALFRERYGMTPSDLRRTRRRPASSSDAATFTLTLSARPPFNGEALLRFLGARAVPGVERVSGARYLRTVALGPHRGWVEATLPGADDPSPSVRIRAAVDLLPALLPLMAAIRRAFDLDAEPERIREHLSRDERLAPHLDRSPGLRLPGAFHPFEAALRAVLGQQVSVAAATTLAGRVAEAFGEVAVTPDPSLTHHAPTPESMAAADPEVVARLGMPRARARAVVALAQAVSSGHLTLTSGSDPESVLSRLQTLPGIGPWTAEYIALRALHWPDAFPAGDLGLRTALGDAPFAEIHRLAERWRPWRGYAAIHLWESLGTPAPPPPSGAEA